MAFMGVKNEDERAALVAYLNKNSDKPADLGGAAAPAAGGEKKTEAPAAAPAPAGEQKAAEAKPAEPAKPAETAKPAAPAEAAKPAEPAKPADQAAAPAAPAASGDVVKLLASADVEAGKTATEAQCAMCHSLNKGGETIAGPNLYGIVGMKHGHIADFEYSDEFKKHEQGPWDFALLDKWLEDPAKAVPGTMMAFPGVKDAQERANIIAFLNKNSDSPAPIPGK
ncbi:c-type cytochrome [Chenggangzhangella methanolivorans]|nr:c-type cytochrome [Chenggangzhangella methanolivorans]